MKLKRYSNVHEKNDFVEIPENLARHRSENNFIRPNNYIVQSMPQKVLLDILIISLSVLRNYFDDPTKLFSDLYLTKFLNTLTKQILSM